MMTTVQKMLVVDDTDGVWFGIVNRNVVRSISSMEYEVEAEEGGRRAYYTGSLFITVYVAGVFVCFSSRRHFVNLAAGGRW